MKLICEQLEEDINVILEEKEGSKKKTMYIEGIFLQQNIKNRNGRQYPGHIMQKEVARYTKAYVNEGRAFGELGHPKGPTINPERISHRIVSLKEDGDNYIGKAILHSTTFGNIARSIIEEGGKLGVSSRGMGSLVERNGVMEVQDDFHLSTAADIVVDPSAPDAFVNGIMEGVEWAWNPNGTLMATLVAEQTRANIDKAVRSRTLNERQMLALFENYLDKITKYTI